MNPLLKHRAASVALRRKMGSNNLYNNEVVMSGWLHKRSRNTLFTKWNKRYFEIRRNYLFYGNNKDKKFKERIEIDSDTVIEETTGRSNAFTIKLADQVVFLDAATPSDQKDWIDAINSAKRHCQIRDGIGESNSNGSLKTILRSSYFCVKIGVAQLHKHIKDNETVTLIAEQMESLSNDPFSLPDFEFYIPQIVALFIDAEFDCSALEQLLMSLCNISYGFALQIFWCVKGTLQDNVEEKYNRCAKLILNVEKSIVDNKMVHAVRSGNMSAVKMERNNSLREIRAISQRMSPIPESRIDHKKSMSTSDLAKTLNDIDGILQQADSIENIEMAKSDSLSELTETDDEEDDEDKEISEQEKKKLLEWMMEERKNRYMRFRKQREFVKNLEDVVIAAHAAGSKGKEALHAAVEKAEVAEGVLIPMARCTETPRRVVRFVAEECHLLDGQSGAVYCFEVVDDVVGVAGKEKKSNAGPESYRNIAIWGMSPKISTGSRAHVIAEECRKSMKRDAPEPTPSKSPSKKQRRMSAAAMEVDIKKLALSSLGETTKKRMMASAYNVFGESWTVKQERYKSESPLGEQPGWRLWPLVCRTNMDLRQECFMLQIVQKIGDIFDSARLPLPIRSYRALSTGIAGGLMETMVDCQSLDSLKQNPDFTTLKDHFIKTFGDEDSEEFIEAQRNFIESTAAYSLICYLLQVTERHNRNILLDREGHIVHIDFEHALGVPSEIGLVFSTPFFKLTDEMIEVMGGDSSEGYLLFKRLCVHGFLALQDRHNELLTLMNLYTAADSMKCFKQSGGKAKVLNDIQDRLFLQLSSDDTTIQVLKMIKSCERCSRTNRFDEYQQLVNKIAI